MRYAQCYNHSRELFYQNVTRLGNQSNLDVAVRDVCCLLESPPWNLGIVATAKGLIAGPLTIVAKDGAVIDCMTSGGTYINFRGFLYDREKYCIRVEYSLFF